MHMQVQVQRQGQGHGQVHGQGQACTRRVGSNADNGEMRI